MRSSILIVAALSLFSSALAAPTADPEANPLPEPFDAELEPEFFDLPFDDAEEDFDLEKRGCVGPDVNTATLNLIKEFEGFVPKPAPDPIGLPTVGYGHLCKTKGCKEVPYKFPLTKKTATKLLKQDLKSFQQTITLSTENHVKLNANQYGALVSWAFNVGSGAARSSTLIKRLNNGQKPNTVIAQELPRWNKAGGKVLPGLVRRRKAEVALAKTPTKVGALPVEC